MMLRVRRIAKILGKSGIDFLITLALYFIFRFTRHPILAFFCIVALIPPAIILIVRGFRALRRRALWSVRNRLLVVYALIGLLPIFLLLILAGLGTWAAMNELAIYLASSALDRRVEAADGAVDALRNVQPGMRETAVPEIARGFNTALPGLMFYFKDETGSHRYPLNAPDLTIPRGWKDVSGLLVHDEHFYVWAHYIDPQDEITVLAPLTDKVVDNLVPHLGVIGLAEIDKNRPGGTTAAVAGSFRANEKSPGNPDFVVPHENLNRIPPPVNSLDLPVGFPNTLPHYHLETPNKTYDGILEVISRPSAVWNSFFSSSEPIRGFIAESLGVIAIVFLLLELIAVLVGVSLARRITSAVNQLYQGTLRVIHGDFRQRIPVRAGDQLGELSQSFNQMTGNLERLLVIEKEKERLQTEIEIAREVQNQLYPKEAPPTCGLKLTVRCDPARMVSGDYYDYQEIGGGKLAFAIGDVAGKGISAALLMATLQASLRAQIAQFLPSRNEDCSPPSQPLDAAHLVSSLNRQIWAHTSPEKFATFFFALFDEPTRTLSYTNAGHLSPILFRNGDVVTLESNGTVVGAFSFAQYDESRLVMSPGDLLVCYTDGVTEPENAYGEMFGEQRLVELIHKYANREDHEIVQIVLEAVRSWTGSPELSDDMTLLLAREVESK